MNVLMTSFQRRFNGFPPFSVAVYQPKGVELPEVAWAKITKQDGTWIRPREFISEPDPLRAYHVALLGHYDCREAEAREWFDALKWQVGSHNCIGFCCWCPYERRAQEQLAEHGSFVCHTAVLGEWIETRLGVPVWYDSDRRKMKDLT